MYGDNFITHFKGGKSDMFEHIEHEKGEEINVEIVDVDLKIRYPEIHI